jgi:hypothetical protein
MPILKEGEETKKKEYGDTYNNDSFKHQLKNRNLLIEIGNE